MIDISTAYMERFGDAMELLCGGLRPSDQMIEAWFDRDRVDWELQEFAVAYGPEWAQGDRYN